MGIINVTPDSFCGDGIAPDGASTRRSSTPPSTRRTAFVAAGAQLLDVGGESTRPRQFYGERPPCPPTRNARRWSRSSHRWRSDSARARSSASTPSKGSVARAALAAGARMVNDVWAARRDPDTARAAAEAGAYLVLMHNKDVAKYDGDVVAEVITWLQDAVDAALTAGVRRDRLLVDPGIGFGKTGEHNLEILHRLAELKAALGLPLLVGTSRKRFIGQLLDDAPSEDRVEGTAATSPSRSRPVPTWCASTTSRTRAHRARRRRDRARDRATGSSCVACASWGRHGVLLEERMEPQPFEVDVVLGGRSRRRRRERRPRRHDRLHAVFELVRAHVEADSFRLIEALAGAIAGDVLGAHPRATSVIVRVRKPSAPLPGTFETVETTVRRTRG